MTLNTIRGRTKHSGIVIFLAAAGITTLGIALFLVVIPSGPEAERSGGMMSGSNDMPRSDPIPLEVRIFRSHYDADCNLLAVIIEFYNLTEQPLYLVAYDFSFLPYRSLQQYHCLSADKVADELILDLSHRIPPADGMRVQWGEFGGYGREPDDVIEIGANGVRYITYVFQFPITLDPLWTEIKRIEQPRDNQKVRFRFGYSREHFECFSKREFKEHLTIEEWQQMLANDWQKRIDTDPITIKSRK